MCVMQASFHAHILEPRSGQWRRWRIECPNNTLPHKWVATDAEIFVVNMLRCTVSTESDLEGTNWNWWVEELRLKVRQRGTLHPCAETDPTAFPKSLPSTVSPIELTAKNLSQYPHLERHPDPKFAS